MLLTDFMIQVGHRATHDLHPTARALLVPPAVAAELRGWVLRLLGWDPPRKIFKQPTVGLCVTVARVSH